MVAGCSGSTDEAESTAPAAGSTATPSSASASASSSASASESSAPGSSSSSPSAGVARPARAGITFGSALYALDAAAIGRELDQVVALRMRWIRVDVSWAGVQPLSRERYDWRGIDRVVDAARSRRLAVLGLVTYTPPWARASGCRTFVCPPRDNGDYARFAAAAARRYLDRGMTTFQLWNEPNISEFWKSPDPEAYRSLLLTGATALRAVSARIRVLFGSLAFVGDAGAARLRGDIDAGRFVRRACAARDCDVDAVGYDPYTYPRLPSDTGAPLNAWQRLVNPAAGSANLRAAMTATGLAKVPVWITAFGAPTSYRGAPGSSRLVGEGTQARILTDGARLAGAPLVGAYFVNTLRDDPDLGPVGGHFGLVRADGSRKPAFAALARALG